MTRTRRSVALAAAGLVLAVPALAACGGSSTTSTTSAGAGTSSSAASSPMDSPSTDAMMSAPFGPGCSGVPTTGAGSFDGMAKDPVATAASNNPALKTLVAAVTKAGLVDTLNNAQDITVLAPTDDAFAAMDQATLKKALGDPTGLLKTVLTYHVIPGRLSPAQLAGTHKTLEGGSVTIAGSGEAFTVDGSANVVCGDVQTANATVYLIDQVLMPKM